MAKGPVHALTFSSGSGQYLLSGSADRTINLYNPSKAFGKQSDKATAAALIQTYSGVHGYEVLSISVASDNSRFVSAGGDKTVFLWDVSTAQTLRRFGGTGSHTGKVECTAFGGEGDSVVISGSYDSTVRFWDTKSQGAKPIMMLDEAKDSVSSLAVHDHEIFTGSIDGRMRRYDLRMGMLHTDVLGASITSITPTLKADSVLVSTLDSTVRLLDMADGKLLKAYQDPAFEVKAYRIGSALALKDAVAISGSEDGHVYAWNVLSGECTHRIQHHGEESSVSRQSRRVVSTVACKWRGSEWASAGGDGTIAVWG
ncbi:MAG: hypothetical protein Q9159_000158 [Coniocarpon cinnabarinum]